MFAAELPVSIAHRFCRSQASLIAPASLTHRSRAHRSRHRSLAHEHIAQPPIAHEHHIAHQKDCERYAAEDSARLGSSSAQLGSGSAGLGSVGSGSARLSSGSTRLRLGSARPGSGSARLGSMHGRNWCPVHALARGAPEIGAPRAR